MIEKARSADSERRQKYTIMGHEQVTTSTHAGWGLGGPEKCCNDVQQLVGDGSPINQISPPFTIHKI